MTEYGFVSREDESALHNDKQVMSQTGGEDYVSNLPGDVICHILYYLPTKDAVRTSVLSKAWEYKWTDISNVYVDDRERFSDSNQRRNKSSFVNFLDRVFCLTHDLKWVHLICEEKYYSSHFTRWISSVLKANTECFEIEAVDQEGIVLPRKLLNNKSLRTLNLKLPCTFKVPLDNCFDNLKSLHLEEVEILSLVSKNDPRPLVFRFPVLETFELIFCKWSNANSVEIHCPALTKFQSCTDPDPKADITVFPFKICSARRIDKFESLYGFPQNFVLYESVVVNARFVNESILESELFESPSDIPRSVLVRNLLTKFSGVRDLKLSPSMCQAIALSIQELPKFDRLQRLIMSVLNDTKLLVELLHIAPSLKYLKINGLFGEFNCVDLDVVPCCVITNLEEIKFVATLKDPLLLLAKFILNNAVELKKICLGKYINEKEEIVDQLSKYPTASASLAIVS